MLESILEKKHLNFFLNREDRLDIDEELDVFQDQERLFAELEIKGTWKYLKSGCSTLVFRKDKGGKIIAFSLDLPKVDYMLKAELPGFKILGIIEYVHDRFMICYEMDELFTVPDTNKDFYSFIGDLVDMTLEAGQRIEDDWADKFNEISHIKAQVVNEVLDNYQDLACLDIHTYQFMVDENEKIWLIDPIISSNIGF